MTDAAVRGGNQPSGSVQQAIDATGNLLGFLRAPKLWERTSPPDYAPGLVIPQIPHEFSSWEREQRGWRDGVALFDQSHHMNGLFLAGTDLVEFISHLACNALADSYPGRAHQIILCNEDGNLIGDGILFHLAKNEMFMCGAPFAVNWVRYNVAVSDLRVSAEYEPRSPVYANGHGNTRRSCRYQFQGPNAWALLEALNGGPIQDVKFFHFTDLKIAGHPVRGLRHGMAGAAGLEVWAPWEVRDEIRAAVVERGREFGLVLVGSQAYLSGAAEGGWIAHVMPAIWGESMRPFREWLPATEMEALFQLNGSYKADKIDDYYLTPYDLGYERIVDLDHSFVGRDALAKIAVETARHPVSLIWNRDDVAELMRRMLDPDGLMHKPIHLPVMDGDHTVCPNNTVLLDGKLVGVGSYTAYTANERAMITLATLRRDLEYGTEVVLGWGEAGGGYGDCVVAPDVIFDVRCTVAPVPYAAFARKQYRAQG